MRTGIENIQKIIQCVRDEPLTFREVCRRSGLTYKTVRRGLQLIEYLQNKENIVKVERDGFRVLIKKSREYSDSNRSSAPL